MLISSSSALSKDSLHFTICIIGGGAAGITLACELDGQPFDVVLLEAGDCNIAGGSPENYQGMAEPPHPNPAEFRRFCLGGSTSVWGGRCVPYDPIDFERRDYIANSGWPISYEEVAKYYPRAMQYCDAGQFDFSTIGSISKPSATIPGLAQHPDIQTNCIERYSLPTNFGARYRRKLQSSSNVTTMLQSRCIAINKKPGEDNIDSIVVAGADNTRRTIFAKIFVLAVGGIETPRLLLATDVTGAGFGNNSDHLGRYYACHFENLYAKLVSRGKGPKPAFHFEKTRDGVYCRRKMLFTPDAQRRHRLLNTAFRLHFPDYSDATHGSAVMSTIYLAKSALIPEYQNILQNSTEGLTPSSNAAHVRNVVTGMPQLLKFGWQWLFLRQLAKRKLPYTLVPNADGSFPLEFNCEQTPMESSRITLSADRDQHGLQRAHVAWRVSADDINAAIRGFHLLRAAIAGTPTCRLEFDETQLESRLAQSIPVGGHHIGTARMSAFSNQGVVNTQCGVFDIPNLYIASSAVFPTSSHANPTLTIVALTLRLGEHLKDRLNRLETIATSSSD